jgi:hypothetical protein
MPKSAFVSALMSYETATITEYNDYCFCVKQQAQTPDAPYGKTFLAWTQYTFINTGNNSCRMVCSNEAEFPNGPPMVCHVSAFLYRQIVFDYTLSCTHLLCFYNTGGPSNQKRNENGYNGAVCYIWRGSLQVCG